MSAPQLTIRERLKALSMTTDSENARTKGPFAVLSGRGSVEAGYDDDLCFEVASTLAEARALLRQRFAQVAATLEAEIEKIRTGIADGALEEIGDLQLAVAQIVTDGGPDEPILPLEGFSIAVDPASGAIWRVDWEETWGDLAGPGDPSRVGISATPREDLTP